MNYGKFGILLVTGVPSFEDRKIVDGKIADQCQDNLLSGDDVDD